jgi:hypothetical protein
MSQVVETKVGEASLFDFSAKDGSQHLPVMAIVKDPFAMQVCNI